MKAVLIALGAISLAVVLVAGGLLLGLAFGRGWGGYGMMGRNLAARDWAAVPCGAGGQDYGLMGPGMMGYGWEEMPCSDRGAVAPGAADASSLTQAETAVERYVDRLGYTGLQVTEMMEFERNYYAIVAEQGTGIGAMEILVDKSTGAVGPEPGPNMMWNARYGMHGRGGMGMMGSYTSGEMTLSPQEAEDVAQHWLDANLPGRTAGEADPFYGYYTFHFLKDGKIEGMLSVHGSSGDVWLHSWHGSFVQMTGEQS
jgi:hypothetical protein